MRLSLNRGRLVHRRRNDLRDRKRAHWRRTALQSDQFLERYTIAAGTHFDAAELAH